MGEERKPRNIYFRAWNIAVIHNGLKFVTQRRRGAAFAFARIVGFPRYKSMPATLRYYYRMNVFKRICESRKERSYERIRNRIHGRYNAARHDA